MGPNQKPTDKRPEEQDREKKSDQKDNKDSAPAQIPERELDNLPGSGGSFESR